MVEFEDSLAGSLTLFTIQRANLSLKFPAHCLGFLTQIGVSTPHYSEDGEVSCCFCMAYPLSFLGSVEQKPTLFNVISRSAFDHLKSAFYQSSFASTCTSSYLLHFEKHIH
jgi:hypothetical protein